MVFSAIAASAVYSVGIMFYVMATQFLASHFGFQVKETAVKTADTIFTRAWDRMQHIWNVVKTSKQFIFMVQTVQTIIKLSVIFFILAIVGRMIVGFFQSPLEYIMLGISCIMLSIFYVFYYIIGTWPFRVIPLLIYYLFVVIIPVFIHTAVIVLVFALICVLGIIFAIINEISVATTNKSINILILCQNSPLSWFLTPNYHHVNKNERGIFCNRPCGPGYIPDSSGRFCERITNRNQPSFCPQAQVMRILAKKQTRMSGKVVYPNFNSVRSAKYRISSPVDREIMLKNHYIQKSEFLNKCSKYYENFNNEIDFAPLNICSNINGINDTKLSPAEKQKLIASCKQSYCNSKSNYTFCQFIDSKDVEDEDSFWIKVIKLLIILTVFFIIVVVSLKYLSSTSLSHLSLENTKRFITNQQMKFNQTIEDIAKYREAHPEQWIK